MKILKIRLENLNSLKIRQTIDFAVAPLSDTGLFAITGDTGAGKTTLLDAVTLALYGRIHRNKEVTEVMSYGSTESLAEVEFESARGLYRAKWSTYRSRRKPDGNIQPPRRELSQWDDKKKDFVIIAEKIREVDALVEEVSGLDYDRFTRSVLLSQGDFAAFLQAGERERSDLLERITGTEVYTRLSVAAYERFRTEQQVLEGLRQEQKALQLLSDAEIESIRSELEQRQEEGSRVRNELEVTREKIQWHRQQQELETSERALEERRAALAQRQDGFRDGKSRLEAHTQALPHRPLMDKTAEATARLTVLIQELSELEEEGRRLREQLSAGEEQLQHQRLELERRQQTKKETFVVLDQVIALDKDLEAKLEALESVQEELAGQESELAEQEQQKQQLEQAVAEREDQLLRLKQWLEEHQARTQLKELLPEVELKREEMRSVQTQQRRLESLRAELEEKRKLQSRQSEQGQQQLERATAAREELTEAFRRALPEGYSFGRTEVLHHLQRDIDELGTRRQQLEQLERFNREYQELLVEWQEYEAQLESLNSQETAIDKEVISAMDALDAAREQLEYRRRLYEQQQLIANYEKDRHQLEEGQPCPLCQSTHHPFREHPVEPFVDRSRADYERSQKAYDRLQQRQNQLLNRQKEIKIQKEQLMGAELQEIGGQMARQLRRIEQIEEQVAGMILGLAETVPSSDRGPALQQQLTEANRLIEAKRQVRDRLTAVNRQLDEQERTVQQLEREQLELQNALQLLEQQIRMTTEQQQEAEDRYQRLWSKVSAIFQRFGASPDPVASDRVFEQLRKDHEEYEKFSTRLQNWVQEQALTRQKLEQAEAAIVKARERRDRLEQQQAAAQDRVEALRRERYALLAAEKDPLEEKTRLETSVEAEQQALEQRKEELHALRTQWKGIQPLQASKTKEKDQLDQQLAAWREQLETAAKESGFSDQEALAAALLPEEQADMLRGEQREIEREITAIEQSAADLEQARKKLQATRAVEIPLEDLRQHLAAREEDYQQLQQQIGGLSERLAADEKQRRSAGKLVRKIERQEAEFARWARLNEIIGQADGKKFRIFAQGLTLSKLVELANHHLESLNGRYLIRKQSDENLELEIIDTFQADNARSMNTLSGGERFLVSLALALGLSDLAGRDARIQSLFIDEGFGTLDENSLDLAIDTLENLQSDGKAIGIISHVKALKERIGTQIRVLKKGTGFSEVEIVG